MNNPMINISVKKLETFLYSCNGCINEVDVPLVLKALLNQLGHKIPKWLKDEVEDSNKRIEEGHY